MTIETATPSSAETIAALFDNLVDAVAARVIEQLSDNITVRIEHGMDTWAMTSGILEDKITEGVQSFVDNQLDVDDVVRGALDNLDLDDMVMTAVQELEFNVRVSR
jgi:ribosomal protein L11 methylase PrmA